MAISVLLLLAGCQRDPAATSPSGSTLGKKSAVVGSEVIKVKVTAGGDITVDGELFTLDQLEAKFAELKQNGGEVWYHRDNPASDPHPNALKVIELVTKNRLPVKLFAKPDFSDAVDD